MTLHDVLGFAVLVLILAGSFALMGLLLTWAQFVARRGWMPAVAFAPHTIMLATAVLWAVFRG